MRVGEVKAATDTLRSLQELSAAFILLTSCYASGLFLFFCAGAIIESLIF